MGIVKRYPKAVAPTNRRAVGDIFSEMNFTTFSERKLTTTSIVGMWILMDSKKSTTCLYKLTKEASPGSSKLKKNAVNRGDLHLSSAASTRANSADRAESDNSSLNNISSRNRRSRRSKCPLMKTFNSGRTNMNGAVGASPRHTQSHM